MDEPMRGKRHVTGFYMLKWRHIGEYWNCLRGNKPKLLKLIDYSYMRVRCFEYPIDKIINRNVQ